MSYNLDDEKNNETIMNWNGEEMHSYIGTPLKLFQLAYKSGQFTGDDKFNIFEIEEFTNSMGWTDKQNDNAQAATHVERMVAGFIKFFVDMYTNDDMESWELQGAFSDNVFAFFNRPLLNDFGYFKF